ASVSLCLLMTLESGCRPTDKPGTEAAEPGPGISLTLATARAQTIEGLSYDLRFTIPADVAQPVAGHAVIRFATKDLTNPVVIDFSPGADSLKSVTVAGKPSHYRVTKDHIIIPKEEIASESNAVEIDFRAGDAALNRSPEFMYTLFVPARAHLS